MILDPTSKTSAHEKQKGLPSRHESNNWELIEYEQYLYIVTIFAWYKITAKEIASEHHASRSPANSRSVCRFSDWVSYSSPPEVDQEVSP